MINGNRIGAMAIVIASIGLWGCVSDQSAEVNYEIADLNGTLWRQTAAEYEASTVQAYELATVMLGRGLVDPSWNALPKLGRPDGDKLAVIMDVDETVLNNSRFHAWLVQNGIPYTDGRWEEWCNDAAAVAISGAREFLEFAVSSEGEKKKVTVFYVTNRSINIEEATVKNLGNVGFPLDAGQDTILTKYEDVGPQVERRKDSNWRSAKGTRFKHVVDQGYRVILLIGDNLGDFVDVGGKTVAERAAITEEHRDMWGTKWIVIPNPSYGSWEQTLYDFDFDLSPQAKQERKLNVLKTWTPSNR